MSDFDNQRKIASRFYSDYTCIEYTDPRIRDTDKANNQAHYKISETTYVYD
jgi:hypothetical protein